MNEMQDAWFLQCDIAGKLKVKYGWVTWQDGNAVGVAYRSTRDCLMGATIHKDALYGSRAEAEGAAAAAEAATA